jgi:FHS family L-fucose permease-like MFS transporter
MKKLANIFRTADGKNYLVTFALVTSLFLLWGFCNGMIDILNKHFQDSLHINKEQSGLVQFANYLAYFLMAIPAGLIARKFGYKGGILVGLTLIAAGAFWFVPATNIGAYWAFLLGLFIIASGMTCLETIANPYTTVCSARRKRRDAHQHRPNNQWWRLDSRPDCRRPVCLFRRRKFKLQRQPLHPLFGHRHLCGLVARGLFIVSKVPDLHAEDESRKSAEQKISLKPSGGQLAVIGIALALVCGLLYFFISPILQLVWTLLNLSQASFRPTKYGLLVIAYFAAFILVANNWDMFRRKHFTLGIATQFLYVAAQTGIFSFFVNYVLENDPGVTKLQASTWLGASVLACSCSDACAAAP